MPPQLSNKGVQSIASGCRHTLRSLDLSHCQLLSEEALFWVAGQVGHAQPPCARLERLSVAGCGGMRDRGVAALGRGCHRLRHLHCAGCPRLTGDGVAAMAPGTPHLQLLSLGGNGRVGDSAPCALGAHCHDLRSLDLTRCPRVSDGALHALADGCPRLERLLLVGCRNITEAGVCVVARACANMQVLNTSGCEGVTDDGLLEMMAGLPFVEPANSYAGFRPKTDAVPAKLSAQMRAIRTAAALRLQALYRGHLARRLAHHLRAVRSLAPHVCVIQRTWRRHSRITRWRWAAAVFLRRVRLCRRLHVIVRGALARRRVWRELADRRTRARRAEAATQVQAWYRMQRVCARDPRVLALHRLRPIPAPIHAAHRAAASIQRAYRRAVERATAATLYRGAHSARVARAGACLEVQRRWRGIRGRRAARAERARQEHEYEVMCRCVVKLQTTYRGRLARVLLRASTRTPSIMWCRLPHTPPPLCRVPRAGEAAAGAGAEGGGDAGAGAHMGLAAALPIAFVTPILTLCVPPARVPRPHWAPRLPQGLRRGAEAGASCHPHPEHCPRPRRAPLAGPQAGVCWGHGPRPRG